jgi:hypothetical protein
LVEATPKPSSEPLDTARSHLDITIPENLADTRITVGTPEGQRSEPQTSPQVASALSVMTPVTNDTSRRDSLGSASQGIGFRDSNYQASSEELALLQRWDPGSEKIQNSSSGFALTRPPTATIAAPLDGGRPLHHFRTSLTVARGEVLNLLGILEEVHPFEV